jgi:hypothetical protein
MKLIEDTKLRNLKYVFKDREHAGTLLSEKLIYWKKYFSFSNSLWWCAC